MGVRKKIRAQQIKEEKKQLAFAKLTGCPTSPRKMRLVADLVRGVEVEKALLFLASFNCCAILCLRTPIAYYFLPLFFAPACPLNERVGENSPNLCPTIFSVTYTGTN